MQYTHSQTQNNQAGLLPSGHSKSEPNDTALEAWAEYQCLNGIEEPRDLYDFYPQALIGPKYDPTDIDRIEIHGIRNSQMPDGQMVFEIANGETSASYSIYIRIKEGGIDCIGDFSKLLDAELCAHELAVKFRWQVENFVRRKLS